MKQCEETIKRGYSNETQKEGLKALRQDGIENRYVHSQQMKR